MLFYQRRKIDNMECSGTSSTSGDHWVSKIAVAPSLGEATSASVTTNAEKSGSIVKRNGEIESELQGTSAEDVVRILFPLNIMRW